MPKRPWITPDDLRTYSDDEGITNRPDEKLQIDISRAESYVLTYTHNRNTPFERSTGYTQILKSRKKEVIHHLVFA